MERGVPHSEATLNEVLAMVRETDDPTETFLVGKLAEVLISKGHLTESLRVFVDALQRNPHDLVLNSQYRENLTHVNRELEQMVLHKPNAYQFCSVYELLVELGFVSFKNHYHAAEIYIQLGEQDRARKILSSLLLIAPNFKGLNSLKEKL
jgi:hypothetical protein